MGLSEEEGTKYWDREARSHDMKVEKHKEKYHTLAQYIIDLTTLRRPMSSWKLVLALEWPRYCLRPR